MIEIKAPNPMPQSDNRLCLFLAGTIDMGNSEDWQHTVVDALKDENIVIYNPRRDNWNNEVVQSINNPEFKEQVDWEQEGLNRADLRLFVFLKDSKSPITFLELGQNINRWGIVVCPEGFYRKGNIDIVCNRAGIPVFKTIETAIGYIKIKCIEWQP